LCFLDQARLAPFSALSVAATLYVLTLLIIETGKAASAGDIKPICALGLGRGQITLIAVTTGAIANQALIPPMLQEMEARSISRFSWVLAAALFSFWLLCTGMSFCGDLLFSTAVPSNILLALPQNSASAAVARASMVVVTVAIAPTMIYPLMHPIEASLNAVVATEASHGEPLLRGGAINGKGDPRAGEHFANFVRVFSRLTLLTVVFILSSCSGSLGVLNDYNGAFSVPVFLVLGPWAVGLWVMPASRWRSALLRLHIVAGVVLTVFGFAWGGGNFATDMDSGCSWYIFGHPALERQAVQF